MIAERDLTARPRKAERCDEAFDCQPSILTSVQSTARSLASQSFLAVEWLVGVSEYYAASPRRMTQQTTVEFHVHERSIQLHSGCSSHHDGVRLHLLWE